MTDVQEDIISCFDAYVCSFIHELRSNNCAHGSCFVVFCCGFVMVGFTPYTSGLLHWHWGNHMIAPVPVKQPWRIWVNMSHGSSQNCLYNPLTPQPTLKMRVVIMPTLSRLVAPKFITSTTCGATSDDKVGIVTTVCSKRKKYTTKPFLYLM